MAESAGRNARVNTPRAGRAASAKSAAHVKELQDELLALSRSQKMTGWYDPLKLAGAGLDILVSTLVSARSDYRMIEAISARQRFFDYAGEQEIWIDYVADVGDGFHPTYAIASLLGRPGLAFDTSGKADGDGAIATERGKILIMGGDEVYPSATRQGYCNRTAKPYEGACWEGPTPPPPTELPGAFPHLFAIPGNHDWYDGLTSFIRLFGQQRTLGVWQTQQSRSYFAIRLPHRFWLLGIDIQLKSDIDKAQIDYFVELARDEMHDGDRVILCNAEPDWVKQAIHTEPGLRSNLLFLEKTLLAQRSTLEIVARIAGDLHHYRHHQAGERHNITAGGGGAFLHPTHDGIGVGPIQFGAEDPPSTYHHKASFPAVEVSRRLAWGNLGMMPKNLGFAPVAAVLYALLSRLVLHLGTGTIVWPIALVLGFVLFTDTRKRSYRILGGATHALAHLGLALGITLGACKMLDVEPFSQVTERFGPELAVMVIAALCGAVLGPTLFGFYLLGSLNVWKRHGNEAFSSLKIQDYKNFLRLHVTERGVTFYPIGLARVPQAWKRANDAQRGDALLVPAEGPLEPHLIEAPFHIDGPAAVKDAASGARRLDERPGA